MRPPAAFTRRLPPSVTTFALIHRLSTWHLFGGGSYPVKQNRSTNVIGMIDLGPILKRGLGGAGYRLRGGRQEELIILTVAVYENVIV